MGGETTPMDSDTVVGTIGIGAAIGVIGLVIWPHVLAPSSMVTAYIGSGIGDLGLIGLFAGLVAILLAAGLKNRSDPVVMAGGAVTLSAISLLLSIQWLVQTGPLLAPISPFGYHRQLLVGTTIGLAIATIAFARITV